ncbi:hypothetical protein LTR10_019485 [Elasticomyces elasticus]|uniref:F-box domain-containing protein n=1 Tax=Exophiala sideris TaxID=1016849 RepID=A0ABR0JMC6_9EURO|nr:hypothetical protein LTR10_019485 [Elasticomyces elasticus]KAK5035511.1 hypothetical protein LTS07_002950 [Exophiala sideris]KAK5039137.1 hypothetical protein LTR13_003393 [Exophiala sideris]KAK5066436.1 hypothetical protein LTR69_002956 [Exophiala sideris]KAK5187113.1 hypothetical protein LTR44_001121 [Eurotiomycetes sp. CCFEE 6388]
MSTPDPDTNIPPARRERSAAPSPPSATGKYLAMARVRQAETARCQQNSRQKQDYLVHLPTNILTQIITNMYKGRVMLVRRTAEKLLSQTEFAKHERCQILLTCKPLYFAAKPIMYSQVEFAFTTPESFDRFFNVDTSAGAERCLLTRHVVCENVQLHPFLYGKESLLGVNAQDEDVVVILDDIDECYEADCEDNDQTEDMETMHSNVKRYGDASGSFPYFDSGD